jgi:hypothetical protein
MERRKVEESLTPRDRFGVAVAAVKCFGATSSQVPDHPTATTPEVQHLADPVEPLAVPGHEVSHELGSALARVQEPIGIGFADDQESQARTGDRHIALILETGFDEGAYIREDELRECQLESFDILDILRKRGNVSDKVAFPHRTLLPGGTTLPRGGTFPAIMPGPTQEVLPFRDPGPLASGDFNEYRT